MARAALEASAQLQDDALARALAARVVLDVVDFSSSVGPNPELSQYGEIIRIATQEPFTWLCSRGPSHGVRGRRGGDVSDRLWWLVALVVLVGLDRTALAAETRGLIYWRRRRPRIRGSVAVIGAVMEGIQTR